METNRKCWLVGYTLPQCERTLQAKLQQNGVECFLPMRKEVRTWADRRKVVDAPVFPNYIFIRTTLSKRWEHLKMRELLKYVAFDDMPATIKDEEIALLMLLQHPQADATLVPLRHRLPAGTRVMINAGRFTGARGVLIRDEDRSKVIVELTAVGHVVKLHVDADQVIPEKVN